MLEQVADIIEDIKQSRGCCFGSLRIFIQKRIWESRKRNTFKRVCKDLRGCWTKGRLFNVHLGNLLMTPTNKSSIAWLDLAEYSISCREMSFNYGPTEFNEDVLQYYQLESSVPSQSYSNLHNFLTHGYTEQVKMCMHLERMVNVAETLHRKWDAKLFIRYMQSFCDSLLADPLFHIWIFPYLLIEHCSDSQMIVTYFILVCTYPAGIDFVVKHMKIPHLHFFMLHIVNRLHSPDISQFFKDFENWLVSKLQLVERAYIMGLKEKLQFFLSFGWPSECFLSLSDQLLMDLNWPQRNEQSVKSFNSSAFIANFVFFLINKALSSEAPKEDLTDCIRLFWRSVPTPFVSVGDLRHLYNVRPMQEHPDAMDIDGESEFISSILDFYPTDCLVTDHQPRSLLHLSRCKVRENMHLRRTKVDGFDLPNTLREYLILKR